MTEKKDEPTVEGIVDDLLPGMKNVIQKLRSRSQELDEKIKETDTELQRRMEGRTDTPAPVVDYGIRVRSLADLKRGAPGSDPRRHTPPRDPVIEPMTDLFDEGEYLRLIAELPGVAEEDVSVTIGDSSVSITAEGSGRRYAAVVALPRPAEIELVKCRNGILEVILR
ncbi:Hsp20/alpha crystallin family protein [Methanocalculus sp.]|uniref:Hsp20/alpha crystallin family protein n=1 Tax=Methanocalculus sp. TaxID=2004547 RepID=UPI0027278982|nr:hypothetical protein [Methanocalculus sp.]MDO8841917.1 hypothetical protein [Methanocalculus sp.]